MKTNISVLLLSAVMVFVCGYYLPDSYLSNTSTTALNSMVYIVTAVLLSIPLFIYQNTGLMKLNNIKRGLLYFILAGFAIWLSLVVANFIRFNTDVVARIYMKKGMYTRAYYEMLLMSIVPMLYVVFFILIQTGKLSTIKLGVLQRKIKVGRLNFIAIILNVIAIIAAMILTKPWLSDVPSFNQVFDIRVLLLSNFLWQGSLLYSLVCLFEQFRLNKGGVNVA